ncbi:MAG: 3-isopropylmalate dehydratase large subunit [Crenarchaeota archaeon]|nr:3-isopropylmalate dehydratase large subunit [Thermoproteota archaeon]MDW8034010.1 3-isopropylmalate dehydratase large subunit [Nitrososphaerota archaeon]
MGETIIQKLFRNRLGRPVKPGEIVVVDIDLAYAHDGTGPLAIDAFNELGSSKVYDSSRIRFVIDHASPSPNEGASNLQLKLRKFARENGIRVYEVGEGICHQVIPENESLKPGMVIVGADSHTVTLGAFSLFATGIGSTDFAEVMTSGKLWFKVPEAMKVSLTGSLKPGVMSKDLILRIIGDVGADGATYMSVEFQGDGVKSLSMASRMTVCNMVVEMGAKNGIFPLDEVTLKNVDASNLKDKSIFKPDENAYYAMSLSYRLDELEPVVAVPHNVDNVKPVKELEGLEINQVFIGSCTNGREEDFEIAARILSKKGVKKGVRCIAIPASRRVFLNLLRNGIIDKLVSAGCTVTHSTCGPCLGVHFGILGSGEVAVSTSNRNFKGRMGNPESSIYLASPATAAASAAEGVITDPRKFIGG